MKSPSWPRVGTGSLCGTRTGLLGGICLSPSLPGSTSLPGVVGEGKARAFRGEPLLEWYVHRDHRIHIIREVPTSSCSSGPLSAFTFGRPHGPILASEVMGPVTAQLGLSPKKDKGYFCFSFFNKRFSRQINWKWLYGESKLWGCLWNSFLAHQKQTS